MKEGTQTILATQLRSWRLAVARATWLLSAILAVGVFLLTASARHRQLIEVAATNRAALAQLGLSENFLVTYISALDALNLVAYSLIALVIFLFRSDDHMAIFVSATLFLLGCSLARPLDALVALEPALRLPTMLEIGLATAAFIVFMFIFPDGRFTPRWTRWPGRSGCWAGMSSRSCSSALRRGHPRRNSTPSCSAGLRWACSRKFIVTAASRILSSSRPSGSCLDWPPPFSSSSSF